MLEYVSEVSEFRKELINPVLFERTFDLPLHEQIVAIVQNLNKIPGLKLKKWELIPYAENAMVNKNHTKDKKIKNNTKLEKINPIKDSWVDLLVFTFEKDIGGEKSILKREMYCFRANKHHYYMIGGKKVMALNQIVDNSTYVKGTELNFKTSTFSYPIKIDHQVKHIVTTDGTIVKGRKMTINIFAKESNFLLYYMAKFGMEKAIEFFKMDGIISVVPHEVCTNENYYYKVSDDIFVELNKQFYKKSQFISDFYLSLIDVIKPLIAPKKNKKASEDKMEYIFGDIYSRQYWMETFAEMYNKRSVKVAKNGLISFERLIDNLSIKKLTSLKIEHRKDIYSVVRYLVTNYDELLKKDNFNLENRRVRNNEVIASYFDTYLRNNINSLLNSEITSERIDRLLNTIGHYSLFKAIRGKNPYDLFRYERYNDNTSIELSRYTMKGAGAISGGKHGTPLKYRSRYPSYLGRIDLNVCSATDPGLTGYLCMNVKLYDGGRFAKKKDPDLFNGQMEAIRVHINENHIHARKKIINEFKHIDKEGFFVFTPKNKPEIEGIEQRKKYSAYTAADGTVFINHSLKTNGKGFVLLKPSIKMMYRLVKDRGYKYDKEGFVHFEFTPKFKDRIDRINKSKSNKKK
jgi:hypothetical protein